MRQTGFSLIELMMVIIVVGIVLSFALPAFGRFRDDLAMDQARAQLIQDVRMARQAAVTRHSPTIVLFGNGADTTNVLAYSVHYDKNADYVKDAGERFVTHGLPRGIRLSSVAVSPRDSLIFDVSGLLRPGTNGGQVVLSTSRGRLDTLVVSATGVVYEP